MVTRSAQVALVADIGGTYARFALANIDTKEIVEYKKFRVSDVNSLEAAAREYLMSIAHRPTTACFAIAGPASGYVVGLVNANWSFTRTRLQNALGADFLALINDREATAYGSAMGYASLSELLVRELLTRKINCKPEQILLTFGANHALDLIIRRFLVANDTVLVDDSGYYPLFAKLKLAQVNIEVAKLGARESIFIAPRTGFFA